MMVCGRRVIGASLAAGALMILLQMFSCWAEGIGFWAPPVLIAAGVQRDLQSIALPVPALAGAIVLGLVIHFALCVAFGAIFANTVRDRTGIPAITYGTAYGVLLFLIVWYLVLPWANLALLRLPEAPVGVSFAVFGAILGGSLAWLRYDVPPVHPTSQPSF